METNPLVIRQEYVKYSSEDHHVWSLLFDRQTRLILNKASEEFIAGFRLLSLDPAFIPRLDVLSQRLGKITGWSLVPVSGLIPSKDFLFMLKKKQFPITVSIRTMEELEFSELPDIFHDIFGHVPMLMNPLFTDFLIEYSEVALEFADNETAIGALTRYYWYTLEMGLIEENGTIKPYGGAILTSSKEIERVNDKMVPKQSFHVGTVLKTDYNNLQLQTQYFVIKSFDQLFASLEHLKPAILKMIDEKQAVMSK